MVQLAAGEHNWCIDVLALEDLSPLADLFTNEAILKVFHSSRQDFEVLYQQLDCVPKPVFDTQLAASFCGADAQAGYATVLKKEFQIELDKSQTRTDWSRRPLSAKQIEYALNDVIYLERLYLHYQAELESQGREAWFLEETESLYVLDDYQMLPERAHQRLNGSSMSIASQHLLCDLAHWREQLAQSKNIPRTWILKDKDLYFLADLLPSSEGELENKAIAQQAFVRRNLKRIIQMTQQVLADRQLQRIWQAYEPFDAEQKAQVKNLLKQMAALAEEYNIAQTMLATRKDLEAFIRDENSSGITKGWREQFLLEKLSV